MTLSDWFDLGVFFAKLGAGTILFALGVMALGMVWLAATGGGAK